MLCAATIQQQPRFKFFPVTDMNRPSASVWVCMPSKDLTASSWYYEHTVRFNFSFFALAVLSAAAVYVSPRPKSSVRYNSHRETAAAFQCRYCILFLAAAKGVFVRVRVCVCVPSRTKYRQLQKHPCSTQTFPQQRTVK